MSGRAATINVIPGQYALSVGRPDKPTPSGWAWVKLTDIARLESGHTPSRAHKEYWDGPISWVGIVDARDHHAEEISSTIQTITEAGLANSAARMLPASTVCLVRTAGSIGHVTVLGRPMATSQDLVNWVCGPHLEPWFLTQLFVSEKESLRRFGRGSAHPTVYFPEVKAFHVCLPPLNEQRRIVAKLKVLQTRSRRAREELDAVPPLLERLRGSILAAAFRGDLTANWRLRHQDMEPGSELLERIRTERRKKWEESELSKLKAKGKLPVDDRWKAKYEEPASVDTKGLPELPNGWCWASFDEIAFDSLYGPRFSADQYADEGLPTLRTTDMDDEGGVVWSDPPRVRVSDAEYAAVGLRPHDLVITRTGTIGKCALYREGYTRALPSAYLIRFGLVSETVDPEYTLLAILSPKLQAGLRGGSTATTQANINARAIGRLAIPVAPIAEQAEIMANVSAGLQRLNLARSSHQAAAAALFVLDRATLAKAFRGELVSQDPNDEPTEVALARTVDAHTERAETISKHDRAKRRTPRESPGRRDAARG